MKNNIRKIFLNNKTKAIIKIRKIINNKTNYFSSDIDKIEKTALNEYHKNTLNAKMVSFEGYEMPVQYPSGIKEEHMACRNNAALFDVSHMGQVKIHGKDRVQFIESLCVSNVQELKPGNGVLTVFLNKNGGIIDDSIVTNMGEYIGIVFNAGRKKVDLENLDNQIKSEEFTSKDIIIEHLTEKSLIALQGPKSSNLLQKIVNGNLNNLGFMEHCKLKVPNLDEYIGIMRCGYTGEDGFELSVSNKNAVKLWELLYQKDNSEGILSAGLGARDTLRLEAGLCLYGHDLNEQINPLEASLKWVIGKRRRLEGGFQGFKSIEAQLSGKDIVKNIRVGFSFSNGPPAREGSEIFDKEGNNIGYVTSGTQSPSLKMNIGIGYVKKGFNKIGTELIVKIRNKEFTMKITKTPFINSNYFRKDKI